MCQSQVLFRVIYCIAVYYAKFDNVAARKSLIQGIFSAQLLVPIQPPLTTTTTVSVPPALA